MTGGDENHLHCLGGCEKSAGVYVGGGQLVCIKCGAPFVPCTPETCPETRPTREPDHDQG